MRDKQDGASDQKMITADLGGSKMTESPAPGKPNIDDYTRLPRLTTNKTPHLDIINEQDSQRRSHPSSHHRLSSNRKSAASAYEQALQNQYDDEEAFVYRGAPGIPVSKQWSNDFRNGICPNARHPGEPHVWKHKR